MTPRAMDRVVRAVVIVGALMWGIASIVGFLEGFVSLAVVNRYGAENYYALTHRLPIVEHDLSIVALMASPIVALFAILFAVPNVEDGRYRRAFIALGTPLIVVVLVAVEFV